MLTSILPIGWGIVQVTSPVRFVDGPYCPDAHDDGQGSTEPEPLYDHVCGAMASFRRGRRILDGLGLVIVIGG